MTLNKEQDPLQQTVVLVNCGKKKKIIAAILGIVFLNEKDLGSG